MIWWGYLYTGNTVNIIKFCDLKFNKIALHLLKYLLHYVDVFAVCKIHFLLKDQHPVY